MLCLQPNYCLILKLLRLSVHGLGAVVPDGLRVPIEDDFMRLHVRKNIQQLVKTEEDGMFIVLTIINGVVEDAGWWYPACKCHRAVSPDSGLYYYVIGLLMSLQGSR